MVSCFSSLLLGMIQWAPFASNIPPALDWASSPISSNETCLLLGGPFSQDAKVMFTPRMTRFESIILSPAQLSESSIKFIIPEEAAESQFDITVDGSNTITLNAPVLWWANGDQQKKATAGGHIRVFGSCVYYETAARKLAAKLLAEAEKKMHNIFALLGRNNNMSNDAIIREATAAMELVGVYRQKDVAAELKSASLLKLTPVPPSTVEPVIIKSNSMNSTDWAVWFDVPETLTLGNYSVALANALDPDHFVELASFISPSEPSVSTISIISKDSLVKLKPWISSSAKVFRVREYGPSGLPPVSGNTEWVNSSVAVEKAIAAAAEAGGGVVYFDRGTYFINSSYGFTIPWGVQLRGEGKELVEIIFSKTYNAGSSGANNPGGPASDTLALFRGPESGTGAWGITNLTIYVTGFHNMIIYVSERTDGFEMTHTRITANSFLGGWGPGTARDKHSNFTWGLNDVGALLTMLGTNYLIENNDLYCDGGVITSTSKDPLCLVQQGNKSGWTHCHGSSFGTIRNNRIWNGPFSHFMSQWQQIVFEQNEITGVSPVSGGQSLGTGPGGGYAQHVYHANNRIQFVWGGDREIITFDDAGAAYLGTVEATSSDGLVVTLAEDARPSYSGEWGGWDGAAVSVLNGTGVGCWRRVVRAGIDASDAPGEWHNPNNRTWIIDRPFPFALNKGQVISITPARSRIIFEKDYFLDGGTLQFYGQAQECVVSELVGERMTGVVAWGQWRGWYTPPCGTMGMPPCSSPRLGGEMGNGIMMNTQLSYLNNRFTVGNKIVRFDATNSEGQHGEGYGKFYNGANFNIQAVEIDTHKPCQGPCKDWRDLSATCAVIYRGNVAENNGGFNIGGGLDTTSVRDIIIEKNCIEMSDSDKAIQISPKMLNRTSFIRDNIIP